MNTRKCETCTLNPRRPKTCPKCDLHCYYEDDGMEIDTKNLFDIIEDALVDFEIKNPDVELFPYRLALAIHIQNYVEMYYDTSNYEKKYESFFHVNNKVER